MALVEGCKHSLELSIPVEEVESETTRVVADVQKRAKLPGFRLYDLRHTFACLLLAAGAPITYVSSQLGHANPTTTLRHYARWIPSKGRRWVDALDASGSKMWNQEDIHIRIAPEAVGMIGEPSGTRTRDPLIKSQVL